MIVVVVVVVMMMVIVVVIVMVMVMVVILGNNHRPFVDDSIRARPLVLRGQMVEAVFQDGTLGISLMVETLEDGTLGQTVRVRNPKTKRELFGKVENEKTIRITL